MIEKNKGGRPHTDRTNPLSVKITDEAKDILKQHPRKSAFIDALIRGEAAQIKCPDCGKVIKLKAEE